MAHAADVARRTTARMWRGTEATWQGCGWPTRGVGGAQGADTWQEATCVHAGPHGRPCGAPRGKGGWRLEGPRVSGPRLGDWGGNTNALPHPTFYTDDFHFFLPCGTMFPHVSSVQVTWRQRKRRIQSGRWRSRGPESTRSLIKARAQNPE